MIASAGYPLDDGTVITANLPWRLSPQEIRERLGFREFRLVNDFEAVAHAAAYVDASEVLRLTGPEIAPVVGPDAGGGPRHRPGRRGVDSHRQARRGAGDRSRPGRADRRQRTRNGAAGRNAASTAPTCRSNTRFPARA